MGELIEALLQSSSLLSLPPARISHLLRALLGDTVGFARGKIVARCFASPKKNLKLRTTERKTKEHSSHACDGENNSP